MTKSQHKLTLRKETLRALNTVDMRRVVGGADPGAVVATPPSKNVTCIQADAPTM